MPSTRSQVVSEPVPGALRFGRFCFDRSNMLLTEGDKEITLPPRALAVLDCLLERPGAVVPKEEIINRVWHDAIVTETSLTQTISLLRRALGDDSQEPCFIKTVHRRGYRFVAPVSSAQAPPPAADPLHTGRETAVLHTPARQPRRWLLRLALGAPLLLALAIVLYAMGHRAEQNTSPPLPTARFRITLPDNQHFDLTKRSIAVSADGRDLVYCAVESTGFRLFRRSLDSLEAVPIAGTEGGWAPFLSPDGRWIAFFTGSELRKVPISGGVPITLCQVESAGSGTWSPDNSIVFSGISPWGLWQIDAAGGEPRGLTLPETASGEVAHVSPQLLPGDETILFTIWSDEPRTAILSLATGGISVVAEGLWHARYLPTGHLMYCDLGSLFILPFDLSRRRVYGEQLEIIKDQNIASAQYTFSCNNYLFYIPNSRVSSDRRLALLTPGQEPEVLPAPPRCYGAAIACPTDGNLLAVTIFNGVHNDLWTVRVADGALSRLTFEGDTVAHVWSPDGLWLAFGSNRGGSYSIYRKPADGSHPAEQLLANNHHQYPTSWSPDGGTLLYSENHPTTGFDIWVLEQGRDGWTSRPLIRTEHSELGGVLSPDGLWLAYTCNETGQPEVFLQPYPDLQGKWQVSVDGGSTPFWSADGGVIYYRCGMAVKGVGLQLDTGVRLEAPRIVVGDLESALVARAYPGAEDRLVAVIGEQDRTPPTEIHGLINGLPPSPV